MQRVVAGFMLLIFLPLLAIVAGLMRLLQGKGILYRQIRIGLNCTPFEIYKLRTMTSNMSSDLLFPCKGEYVTRMGHFLRVTKIDELPQLVNVIKKEMNLVGPRPLRVNLHRHFMEELPHFGDRYTIAPGITGLSQVVAPDSSDRSKSLLFDLYYVRHKSVHLDILIILSTITYLMKNIGSAIHAFVCNRWMQAVLSDTCLASDDIGSSGNKT